MKDQDNKPEKAVIKNLENFSESLASQIQGMRIQDVMANDFAEEIASIVRGFIKSPMNS